MSTDDCGRAWNFNAADPRLHNADLHNADSHHAYPRNVTRCCSEDSGHVGVMAPWVMAVDDCVSPLNHFTHLLKTPTHASPGFRGAPTMPPTSCPSIRSCRASPAPWRRRGAAGAGTAH